jgi:hypothetical protein
LTCTLLTAFAPELAFWTRRGVNTSALSKRWSLTPGLVVPIPTLPRLVMIIRSMFAVKNRRDGFGAVAEASGLTFRNPTPRP